MSDGPDPIDTRLVRRLAGILNDTGLSEIEVERGTISRLRSTATLRPSRPSTVTRAATLAAPSMARSSPLTQSFIDCSAPSARS